MTTAKPPLEFLAFSEALAENAERFDDVIGLVLVGSTADFSRADEWSDHDFFLVVKTGFGEKYRNNLSWLPNAEDIILSPRETAHGLKVVYRNGHVLEFAVFENEELELAAVNYWAVPVDKANITERVSKIENKTKGTSFDEEKEWGLFLAFILIAVGRARRGEILTAGQAIRSFCLNHLLGFVRNRIIPVVGTENLTDNLDRYRRFEKQFPNQAAQLDKILQLPVEESAMAQLEFLEKLGGLTDAQVQQANYVKARLNWA